MDYWEDCINEAFEDAGIEATKEQIDTVISWVDGAHENYGMATGRDCIPNPMESQLNETEAFHKRELAELEGQILKYRKSVAIRRGVPLSNVYLDGDDVIYG